MASISDFIPQMLKLICPNCDANMVIAIILIFFFEGFFIMEYFLSRIKDKKYKIVYKENHFIVKAVFLTILEATSFYFWFLIYLSFKIIGININFFGYEILILLGLGFLTSSFLIAFSYWRTKNKGKISIMHSSTFLSSILFLISLGFFMIASVIKIQRKNPFLFVLLFFIYITLIVISTSYPDRIGSFFKEFINLLLHHIKMVKKNVIGKKDKCGNWSCHSHHSGQACIYGLGFIGAAIYFISQASGFWSGVLGFLKALVWPVFLVLELFKFLGI